MYFGTLFVIRPSKVIRNVTDFVIFFCPPCGIVIVRCETNLNESENFYSFSNNELVILCIAKLL